MTNQFSDIKGGEPRKPRPIDRIKIASIDKAVFYYDGVLYEFERLD